MTRRRGSCLLLGIIGLLIMTARPALTGDEPDGIRPVGADGKPLNLDFETGTLRDWTAEGAAFAGQPIKGDTVFTRRSDMKSQHQGEFWIGTYERQGDKPQGTLTSVSFKVTHPWASFRVNGGAYPTTCVELVRRDTNQVFSRTSGTEEENLRRVAIDLRPHLGKEIFIRLVDRHAGHWGHINFDDFRFHSEMPNIAQRPAAQAPPPPDVYKYAGLPPEKAAEAMTVPEGFEVKLFAGEPDVHQPIAMCLDDRGRVWIAEAYSYPNRRADKDAHDRILIFEDVDGDGKFDKKTVFMEGLNLISGLEVGFGGVWIGAAPYFMFVPTKNGEDKPAGPPQVLLDGWGYQDTHETLNTFMWGPDGWLYGCHGVFTHSRVGKPGTPDGQRTPINAGIWRYHPTKHVFEVFSQGTSNPWGLDFNDQGQAFIEACVIPHCFHMIQGARYHRQGGVHFNPYTYADIQTIADHLHYVGATPHGGNNRSDSAGGGHAHCGNMIYLGGTWPARYRNQMFMGNIHGKRLNVDILNPKGSGYVASHGPDFLMANDEWARFINMRYGPDGNAYLFDWYDKQACHRNEPEIWDRTNGRIYKVSFRGSKPVVADLRKLTDAQLVEHQLNANDWYVRHGRRLLQERGGNPAMHQALAKIAFSHADETRRLRGLWALHVTGGLTEERIMQGLVDGGAYVRGWTIQLALENKKASQALLDKLAEMARSDASPVVRLYLASGLQRLPLESRWPILDGLIAHVEDAQDHNLPLMYWYAAEPLAELDMARAMELATASKIPLAEFMTRRIAAMGTSKVIAFLVDQLGKNSADAVPVQKSLLGGLNEALKGQRQVPMPAGWPTVYARLHDSQDADVRNQSMALAVTFGDPRAMRELREILVASTDSSARQKALASLLSARDKELAPVLQKLVADQMIRGAAIRGLAAYDDPQTPALLLSAYASLGGTEKRDALNTLASRLSYAKELLQAIGSKKIPSGDVSADVIRQLRNLKDAALDKQIVEVWGIVRDMPRDKARLMTQYKKILTAPYKPRPDLALGRAVYAKTCAQCHVLFGTGGKVGPDITGANRANLDYLLENVLDPSAVIPKEYAATVLALNNGRLLTGIVKEQTPAAVTIVTANETVTVPRGDIESMQPTSQSMMPDDQLKPFKEEELRGLFAYLMSPAQVPMLATTENVKDFFNGKDLTGWDGDPKLWRVEDGEIVGRSPGIAHNSFLKSQTMAGDFRLTFKVKLSPNKENSGMQFRSEALPDGEMKGYQADIGAGWWGKLYEENGRALLWDKSGEAHVHPDQWNEYEVIAQGSRIRTFINGKPCVDLDDPRGARRGIFAMQIHSGGKMEVRFKELKLEVLAAP